MKTKTYQNQITDLTIFTMEDRDMQGYLDIHYHYEFEERRFGIKSITPIIEKVEGILEDFEDSSFKVEDFSGFKIDSELEGLELPEEAIINLDTKTIEIS